VKPRAREIKQNFDSVNVFQQMVREARSERHEKGTLVVMPNMRKRQAALVENFLEISMSQLSSRSDMNLPVMPLTNIVPRLP
jgi:superfamily II helicase